MSIKWIHVCKICILVLGIQLMDPAVDMKFSVRLPDEMLRKGRRSRSISQEREHRVRKSDF